MFSVGFLSRFMEDPKEDHKEALKHLLRYIAATTDYGLQYERGEGGGLDCLGTVTTTWGLTSTAVEAQWECCSSLVIASHMVVQEANGCDKVIVRSGVYGEHGSSYAGDLVVPSA
jgi:hypothetical protein